MIVKDFDFRGFCQQISQNTVIMDRAAAPQGQPGQNGHARAGAQAGPLSQRRCVLREAPFYSREKNLRVNSR
jgi:hypothetical protein